MSPKPTNSYMALAKLDTLVILVNDKELARTLRVLLDSNDGLSTRKFLAAAGSDKMIHPLNRAREKGLVRTKQVKQVGQKGNHLTMNILTAKGNKLGELAKGLGI